MFTRYKEIQFFSKPKEIITQLLQEEVDLHFPVNNPDYYPYYGA